MLSSSTVSIFVCSIFLLFLMPDIIATRLSANNNTSQTNLQIACSEPRLSSNQKLCIRVLQSNPKIVASATNLKNLSIEIIKAGISNATNTRRHIGVLFSRKWKVDPKLGDALQKCNSSYVSVIASFNSALGEVRAKQCDTATYDLLVGATDYIEGCIDEVASKNITGDDIISKGNNLVTIYGLSAYQVINLELMSTPPPPKKLMSTPPPPKKLD